MKKFKYFIFVLLAITATIAFAAATDKYISSQGNIVIKTAASKTVGIQGSLYTKQTGEVGIGTATPGYKLEISSNADSFQGIKVSNLSNTSNAKGGIQFSDYTGASQGTIHTLAAGSMVIDSGYWGLDIKSGSPAVSAIVIPAQSQKVGIGTATPSTYGVKLDVYNPATSGPSWSQVYTFGGSAERLLKIGLDSDDDIGLQAMKNDDSTQRNLSLNLAGGNVIVGGQAIAKTTYGTIKQGTNVTAGHNAGTYKTEIASGATTCDTQCATDASNAGFNSSSGRCLGAWYFDGTWQGCSGTGTLTGKTCLCMGTY